MESYVSVVSPGAPRSNEPQPDAHANAVAVAVDDALTVPPPSPPAARRRSSFFDDSDDVSGEPVDDPELEAAADQVDVSTRFLCVSRDFVDKYIPVVVSISLGAYFGVGIRILLTEFVFALSGEHGAFARLLGAGFFLPNAVGCFVMGFSVRGKVLLRSRFSVYVTGITTGFCGCCTTFASWDVAVAATFVHGLWLSALLMIGVQVACAMVTFRAGVHLAEALIAYLCARRAAFSMPPVDARQLHLDLERHVTAFNAIRVHYFSETVSRRVVLTTEAVVTAQDTAAELVQEIANDNQAQGTHTHKTKVWACVAAILLLWLWIPPFVSMGNYPSSRLFALAMGPFGALLRYYFSLFNTRHECRDFPLYTFIPNVCASVLSCLIILIGSATSDHGSAAYRAYVFLGDGGLVVGFCGSLSTVSTWVNELDTLSSRSMYAAYRYALGSIVVSQLASVFILGLYDAYATTPLIV